MKITGNIYVSNDEVLGVGPQRSIVNLKLADGAGLAIDAEIIARIVAAFQADGIDIVSLFEKKDDKKEG